MSDSLSSRKLRLRPFPTEFSGIPAYNPYLGGMLLFAMLSQPAYSSFFDNGTLNILLGSSQKTENKAR